MTWQTLQKGNSRMTTPSTSLRLLAGLLTVSAILVMSPTSVTCAGKESSAQTSVTGTMVDVPVKWLDGSFRFHVLEAGSKSKSGNVVVPVGGRRELTTVFADNFDSARESEWAYTVGAAAIDSGRMVFAGGHCEAIVKDLSVRNGSVSVDLDAAAYGGILVKYKDQDNYVLAFYSPAQKMLAFHEKIKGNFGNWTASASTTQITGSKAALTAEIKDDLITATISDDQSHTATASFRVDSLTGPGKVGLYYDTAASPTPQHFDNFRVSKSDSVVSADAVQVVIPSSLQTENSIWSIGDKVKITGVAGKAQTVEGDLRAIVIRKASDIVSVEPGPSKLFPSHLPGREWVRFKADGYSQPVCGVVHRMEDIVTNGMALGGVDTGCVDLETSGLLGYCTIFNTHVPRRGPINLPILGLSTGGQTWVLCDKQPKQGWGGLQVGAEPEVSDFTLGGVRTAKQIHYWGHYPVADIEFETDAPISVGLRAWSPFLPGDVVSSMIPAAVFEVRLRNSGRSARKGTVAFSFPGPTKKEAGCEQFTHKTVNGEFDGIWTEGKLASYAIGVIGKESPRLGGGLGADGSAWAKIADALPDASNSESASSVAVDFNLAPGKEKIVRFALTWYAPTWNGQGANWNEWHHTFTHMYAKHYPDAVQTANLVAKDHKSLLKRVMAWQEAIYTDKKTPFWLQDSLINSFYLITETGHWAQKKDPMPAWVKPEDGLWGMDECPRGCAQIECIPCSFYGNQPVVYFFPELALSTLRGYAGYQYPDGCPPWTFTGFNGGRVEFADPTRGYQWASNGVCLASLVHRFLMCHDTKDKKYLKEFYPAIKKCMEWTINLRTTPTYTTGQRVISMPNPDSPEQIQPPTEWFEAGQPGWQGMTAHIAGLHLAQLRITEQMAKEVGDTAFASQCAEWIKAGAEAMEKYLWDPRGYYLNYFEPDTKAKSEFVFGYQLDGEWITDQHGLPSGMSDENKVKTVLETIKRCNIAVTKYGAVNYANPDGTPANPGGYGTYSYFPPEALMLAMNYIYEGQKDFGMELARKVWHNLLCLQGYTWDMPNIMRGDVDTGERTFGNDYYQDMMIWSLVSAMDNQPFDAPCKPGGLVHRVLKAAEK